MSKSTHSIGTPMPLSIVISTFLQVFSSQFYNNNQQMSQPLASSFQRSSLQKNQQKYYIVKDDFITNLRKGRRYRARTEPIQQRQPAFIEDSCIIVNKKSQIQKKLPFRRGNDFYQLDKQIKTNSRSLYRKMTVALRRSKEGFQCKMRNPFSKEQCQPKKAKVSFDQQKNLSNLIYYVQPYWIKKYISKNPQNSMPFT